MDDIKKISGYTEELRGKIHIVDGTLNPQNNAPFLVKLEKDYQDEIGRMLEDIKISLDDFYSRFCGGEKK